jgi:hypothetical protein
MTIIPSAFYVPIVRRFPDLLASYCVCLFIGWRERDPHPRITLNIAAKVAW